MKTVILIYLAFGIILNLIGPLANKIREQNKKLKIRSLADPFASKKSIPKWKIILVDFIIRFLTLLFFPILYLVITIDFFRDKSPNRKTNIQIPDKLLYFGEMGGMGKVTCNNCDFSEDVVGFLHGFGEGSWNKTGFQCQKCGKFHAIEYDMKNEKGKRCECGGTLDRDKPIFCPSCRSNDITYKMRFIT